MTDNEIIKALECCNGWHGRCLNCPLNREGTNCKEKLNSYALDLINRQKAEIEELRKRISYLEKSIDCSRKEYNRLLQKLQQAKSEAIKEFCEKRGIKYVEDDV